MSSNEDIERYNLWVNTSIDVIDNMFEINSNTIDIKNIEVVEDGWLIAVNPNDLVNQLIYSISEGEAKNNSKLFLMVLMDETSFINLMVVDEKNDRFWVESSIYISRIERDFITQYCF
ncbi:hypothetical protein KQI61_07665 [Anaerocolumna aminovalerica]|uniref:hypothetical protein n=1 Tax=Anaerocolumna aminovalerica TaxID=1527 RepID=UPI001C0EB3DC|nr:hypothetical protein [Anaerocolumna aminovalerica]MBU5332073.1 hypothetical protein [Anaerocolumna aminovalerica]